VGRVGSAVPVQIRSPTGSATGFFPGFDSDRSILVCGQLGRTVRPVGSIGRLVSPGWPTRSSSERNHVMTRPRRPRSTETVQSPLETYLREINETALLNGDQEKELAHRIGAGDVSARDQMVRANLRLVVNIARGYTGKGLALQDLIE